MAANVNNYIAAGRAAVQDAVGIQNALADNKPKYDQIAKASIQKEARNRANIAANNARTADAVMDAKRDVAIEQMEADTAKDIRGINKQARMTGMLAGGAALLGIGAMQLNKKEEEDPTFAALEAQMKKINERISSTKADINRLSALGETLDPDNIDYKDTNTSDGKTDSSKTKPSSDNTNTNTKSVGGSTLTGAAKTVADAIAKYESGDWGYEAFNQGGAAGGTKVVGKSGSYLDTYGTPLTGMTLQQIFDKQNTKQKGMSFQEHLDSGGLHAVGRYQFIGSTLQDEVKRMGLDPSTTKFTPEIQDAIFKSHIKRVGNISPWVGPMQNYSQSEREKFNSMIQQF
nr:hypothetical protein 106 [Pelagibacteraceae bacterium]